MRAVTINRATLFYEVCSFVLWHGSMMALIFGSSLKRNSATEAVALGGE
jgi:hypothetical protein